MKESGGVVYYFNNLVPFDFHDSDDYSAQQTRIAKLFVSGGAAQQQLQDSFGKSRCTVQRIVRIFKEEGERGFYKQRKLRHRTAISDDKLRKASQMLSLLGRKMRSVAKGNKVKGVEPFCMITKPTTLQSRAFELLGVKLQ